MQKTIPRAVVKPIIRDSLFGLGRGKYESPASVMSTMVAPNLKLESAMRTGLPGFDYNSGKDLVDVAALDAFCLRLQTVLGEFLTEDDALAVRFAVLRHGTKYETTAALREAKQCGDKNNGNTFKALSTAYVFDEVKNPGEWNRDKEVAERWGPVSTALRSAKNNKNDLVAKISAPKEFFLQASPSEIPLVNSKDAYSGEEAIERVAAAGPIITGCYRAVSEQNLSAIPALAYVNGNLLGVLGSFSRDGKLTGLSFMPQERLMSQYGWQEWPRKASCSFLSQT